MDELSSHDNVFVIFTMNSTFYTIDALDKSYTRSGRIDLKVNFGGDDSYNTTDKNFFKVSVDDNIAEKINTDRFTPMLET